MNKKQTKETKRLRRQARIRSKISGTAERPRLAVFRSLSHVTAQLIDDASGKTLASVSSKTVKNVEAGDRSGKVAQAYAAGKELAEKAKAQNINTVVFDRGGFTYHGRVKAVAEGAREGGLQF